MSFDKKAYWDRRKQGQRGQDPMPSARVLETTNQGEHLLPDMNFVNREDYRRHYRKGHARGRAKR